VDTYTTNTNFATEFDVSLVFTSSGRPAMSYYDWTNRRLRYAQFDGSNWITSTVDNEVGSGAYSSLVLNPSNQPTIVYSASQMKSATLNGGTWSLQNIGVSGTHTGIYPTLLFTPDSRGHVMSITASGPSYVRLVNNPSTGVSIPSVPGVAIGRPFSAQFNPAGQLTVAATASNGSQGELRYATFSGVSWRVNALGFDEFGRSPVHGFVGGQPVIAYYSGTSLRYAIRTP
jgi:hypothetical protein